MQLQTAQRKYAKIKMGIQGVAGSGKTYSALLLAYGIIGDWSKIGVIDSENDSSHLYSELGPYQVMSVNAPHTPDKYISAITICEQAHVEVIIIDSATHFWEYILDYHSSLQGNSFTNWAKVNPLYNSVIQKILHSPTHIICTIRKKQEYVLNKIEGKMVPEKVGLKSVQRDSLDYEFTLVFDLDSKNFASATKDRTRLFFGKPDHIIDVATGQQIAEWCNSGAPITADFVSQRIGDVTSIQDLLSLYLLYPQFKKVLQTEYEEKKRQIMLQPLPQTELNNNQILSPNGIH